MTDPDRRYDRQMLLAGMKWMRAKRFPFQRQ
jgi:hypothetical protein